MGLEPTLELEIDSESIALTTRPWYHVFVILDIENPFQVFILDVIYLDPPVALGPLKASRHREYGHRI